MKPIMLWPPERKVNNGAEPVTLAPIPFSPRENDMNKPKPIYWVEETYCPSQQRRVWKLYGNFGGEHIRIVVADYWHPREAYLEMMRLKNNPGTPGGRYA